LKVPSKRLFGGLLWEKDSVDVWQHTSSGNGDTSQKLVELLVVLDGKGDVTRNDTALLVVTGSVSGKLEDLGTEVLEDGSEVDWGAGTHTGSELSLTEVTSDTTDWELKTSLGRSSGGLLLTAASLTLSFSC
jgi:hypothetical protein